MHPRRTGRSHHRGAPPPPAVHDVRARLEARDQRLTPQREAVYEYLKGVHHHPTAEEVYLAVKEALPRVSLATVYNALEVLVDCGLASKFTYGNASARYDIRTDEHSHARCVRCGRVADLDITPDARWLGGIDLGDFRPTEFRFELLGECGRCSRRT